MSATPSFFLTESKTAPLTVFSHAWSTRSLLRAELCPPAPDLRVEVLIPSPWECDCIWINTPLMKARHAPWRTERIIVKRAGREKFWVTLIWSLSGDPFFFLWAPGFGDIWNLHLTPETSVCSCHLTAKYDIYICDQPFPCPASTHPSNTLLILQTPEEEMKYL